MSFDPVIQVWTAPKSAGGAPLGAIPYVLSEGRVTITHAISGNQGVTLSLPRALAIESGLDEGTWLRIVDPIAGVTEWPVMLIVDADGSGRDVVQVQAGPLRHILTVRGRIRSIPTVGSPTTTFTPGARTVDQLMALLYTPNLSADGLAWLAYRGSEYTATIDVGTITDWTRARLLDEIERRTGYEWEITNDGDAGYTLTLVRRRGASADTIALAPNVALSRLERTRDITAGVTVVEPVTSGGVPIGETCWRVKQISGTGPWWVVLEDPAGGPAVIREDGQLVGAYVVPADSAPIVIDDSRSSDSAVKLASIGGLAVGALVTLWATPDGLLVSSITSPSGLGSTRGRIVQTVQGASPYVQRNLAPDGLLRGGFSGWDLYDFTLSTSGAEVFSRSDPFRTVGAAAGSASSGVTSLNVDGFPAGFVVRRGVVVQVQGASYTCDGVAVVSATGTATVPIDGTIASTIAGDVSMIGRAQGRSFAVRTDGTNSAGASSLTLKDLPPSTALAASDVLTLESGSVALVQMTSIAGTGPYTYNAAPLPFTVTSGTVLRVNETQVADGPNYSGGLRITSIVSAFILGVDPIPVDIPAGTVLTITEVRRQLVGTRTQTVTYTAVVDVDYLAGDTLLGITENVNRPPETVFVFESAAAPYRVGGETRTVTYDATLTADFTVGNGTFTATATTRPNVGWLFVSATADVRDVTTQNYTLSGSPPLWGTNGKATTSISAGLANALPAGTVFRWRRGSTILGDLVLDAAALSGATSITLQGGSAVQYVAVDTTFELPSFTTYTTAATSANGSGACTLTVPATPSAISDNAPIAIVHCPDLAPSLPGGPNVVRLRGASGGPGGTPTYRSTGIFGLYLPPVRVTVPAGESRTVRARFTYTLWGAAAGQAINCRMVLYNVTGTAAVLDDVAIDDVANINAPYSADLQAVTHGTLEVSATITSTTRLALAIFPLSAGGGPLGFLFARSVAVWVGDEAFREVDGADNNALWHKAQDVLQIGQSTARYRGTLSPLALQTGDRPTLGGLARIASPFLAIDATVRMMRVVWTYPQITEGPAVEFDVLRPLLSRDV